MNDKNNLSTFKSQLQFITHCYEIGLCTKEKAEIAMIDAAKREVEEIDRRLYEFMTGKKVSQKDDFFYPNGIDRAVPVEDTKGVNIL